MCNAKLSEDDVMEREERKKDKTREKVETMQWKG
jgi:hypothetical protein